MVTTAPSDQTAARDRLQRRLEVGDRRIAEAQQAGQKTTGWEDFWIELLREYMV